MQQTAQAVISDPVWGVDLGFAGSVYAVECGATYQFCSARCKGAFRAAPHRYVRGGLLGRMAAMGHGVGRHGDGGGRCC